MVGLLQTKRYVQKYGEEKLPSFWTLLYKIIKISVPAALETLLIGITGLVDTIMVSGCGTEALAAVSITQQPVFVTLAFSFGLNAGITAIVARRKGENDQEGANNCLRQSMILCLIVGGIVTLLANVLAVPFLRLAQAQDDTINLSATYFRFVSIALIFNYLRLGICAALRAAGNTKTTLVTNIVANVVNIILNYCLIQGNCGFPALGVKGAAIATAIGNSVAFIIAVLVVFLKKGFIHLTIKDDWKLNPESCKNILKVSTPAFIEQLFMRFGFFLIGMIVNGLGTEASAMNAIISGLISLAFNITDGFAIGCASLVGMSLGEKRKGLAFAYARLSQISSFCLGCIMISIIFLFRVPLSSLFSDDPKIIEGASTVLYFAVFVIFPQSLQWVTTGALRGAGDVGFTARTSMLSVAIIRPIFSFVLCYPIGLGLMGSWIGMFADQLIRFAINNYRLTHFKWMELKV